jgi:hypothetical protein
MVEADHLLTAVDRQTPMVITASSTGPDEAASRATPWSGSEMSFSDEPPA